MSVSVRRLALLLLVLSPCFCHARELNTGVCFQSYDVDPEKRTEIDIPAKGFLDFEDSFSLSFSVRVLSAHEHFGYVCRLFSKDCHSFDIVLVNPVSGTPRLSFIDSGQEMLSIPADNYDSFKNIEVIANAVDSTMRILIDGNEMAEYNSTFRTRSLRVAFGSCSYAGLETYDCAPMVVKNIRIRNDRKEIFWPLDLINDERYVYDQSRSERCLIRNAEWEIRSHSEWVRVDSLFFSSKTYPVLNPVSNSIYFVGKDAVGEYNIRKERYKRYYTSAPVDVDRITNSFVADGDELYYYNCSDWSISRFSRKASDWDRPIARSSHSPYLKGISYLDKEHGRIIHMFGYGFHKYSNCIIGIDMESDEYADHSSAVIGPRYLSSGGVKDGKMLIYGGKGNESGRQELGTVVYNDIYFLNLDDFTVEKSDVVPELESEVAVHRLIPGDDSFVSLFFNPSRSENSLQLKEVSLKDGHVTPLANPIPFNFYDTESFADIMVDREAGKYYSVCMSKTRDGYKAVMWSLSYPVLPLSSIENRERTVSAVWYILLALLSGSVVIWLFVRKKDNVEESDLSMQDEKSIAVNDPSPQTPEPASPGIYLLGGFKAIDRNGEDITKSFTPMMKHLLSLIILCSEKTQGVSNEEMREALWPDKTRDSFFNNRSVNVRKIRMALDRIGDININSNETFWYYIESDNVSCDYLEAMRFLKKIKNEEFTMESIEKTLSIAKSGTLLSYIPLDCFDRFKSEYSDLMVSYLSRVRDIDIVKNNILLRKRVCDAILIFDSTDESTVLIKCLCLVSLKRSGLAKSAFDNFKKEYLRLMDEDYGVSFNDFLNIKQ